MGCERDGLGERGAWESQVRKVGAVKHSRESAGGLRSGSVVATNEGTLVENRDNANDIGEGESPTPDVGNGEGLTSTIFLEGDLVVVKIENLMSKILEYGKDHGSGLVGQVQNRQKAEGITRSFSVEGSCASLQTQGAGRQTQDCLQSSQISWGSAAELPKGKSGRGKCSQVGVCRQGLHPVRCDVELRLAICRQVPEQEEDPLGEGELAPSHSVCAVESFQLGSNALR
eukprot:6474955-Amphidinium_carterae.2